MLDQPGTIDGWEPVSDLDVRFDRGAAGAHQGGHVEIRITRLAALPIIAKLWGHMRPLKHRPRR